MGVLESAVMHPGKTLGGAKLTWWVIIPMFIAGFLTPWPYNYWRLKKYGVACH